MSAIARGTPAPGGLVEKGHFLGGTVGADDFHLDFDFASQKDPQTYTVHGRIQDHLEWRILRLKVVSRTLDVPRVLIIPAGILLPHLAYGVMPEKGLFVAFGVAIAIYAIRNLFFLPDLVTGRVAGEIAAEVNGSVQVGTDWVVPS